MNKIHLISIEEGKLEMPEKIAMPSDLCKADLKLHVKLHMFYAPGEDVIIQDLIATYHINDERIMRYGLRIVYHINLLAATLGPNMDAVSLKQNDNIVKAVGLSIATLRGALFVKLQTTPLNKALLPIIDVTRVIDNGEFTEIKREP